LKKEKQSEVNNIQFRITSKVNIRGVKPMLHNSIRRWYFPHIYGSPLLGTTLKKVTPLLRKSSISYGNHSYPTEVTFNYESHLRKSV